MTEVLPPPRRLELPVIEPTRETPAQITTLQQEIRELARRRKAVVLAHNYQRPEVQDAADYVGDSLGLSRQAAKTPADVIIFAGVHFMAETAAILSPTKRVLLPDLKAGCSLAATITAEQVRQWRAEFPDYVAVGYVNTTADVKAELDYCCTSGNVLEVIDAIPADRGILFLPDFFLGAHARRMRPDRRIEVWMGECHVHRGGVWLRGAADLRDRPGGCEPRGRHHRLHRGNDPRGHRAPDLALHHRDRDRDHASDGADGAAEAVRRGRPGGRLRLHEGDHPHRGA